MARPNSARPQTRALRTRVCTIVALVTAVLAGAVTPDWTAEPASAAPGSASTAPTPFANVSLVPYFTGEPSWPSSVMASFALRVDLKTDYAIPGSYADLTLSDGIVAVTAPEVITTSDQVPIADVEILDEGHTLRLTYTAEAGDLQEISGTMSVFANSTDVTSTGGTIIGEARSGDTTFPLSLPYTGQAWDSMNIISSWQPGTTASAPHLRTRSLAVGNPDAATEGGQWIGVGGVDYWPGRVAPIAGTTRVFALDALPEHLAGLTDPAAILTEDVDYTLNEQDESAGVPVSGVSIPSPRTGIYVVEQLYVLVSPGAPFFDAPNPELPDAGRAVYGAGTQVASGTVQSHATPGGSIQSLSALTFFAGGGATANATASEPALSATRTVGSESPDSGSTAPATRQISVTVTNDGTTRLDARLDETIASSSAFAIDAASATTGSVSTASSTLVWHGILEPGERATISYTVRVDRLPDSEAVVSLAGSTLGASPGGFSVAGTITDDSFSVAAAPIVPVDPEPEPGERPDPGEKPEPGKNPDQGTQPGQGSLPSTGASASGAMGQLGQTGLAILAALLGAGMVAAGLLGSSRRQHLVFTERSIRSTPVS